MTQAAGREARLGGHILADALVAQGVTHAFCVPGESYLDLLDGLYAQRNRLQLVTCRFEAGAIHMAEAYGKLTGRPGVALVTRGPDRAWRKNVRSPGAPTVPATNRSGGS